MGKTIDFLGTGKETTKQIAKKSINIALAGVALGIAGVGLGYGLTAIGGAK